MQNAEIGMDVSLLWRGLRRHLIWILGSALLASVLAYFLTQRQSPVYETSAVLIAANTPQGNDDVLGSGMVKAPPLPPGALDQAVKSSVVLDQLVKNLQQEQKLAPLERDALVESITQEVENQTLHSIDLQSQVDGAGNGLYTVLARADTPEAAKVLANQTVEALKSWDRGRALESIKGALAGFSAQLSEINTQLAQPGLSPVEQQTLVARRASVQGSLARIRILETSATGVLSELSYAMAPKNPVAPKPWRTALAIGLLTLLVASALAALRTLLDRTVRDEDDLISLGLPTLAVIPRIRQRDVLFSGIVRAAQQSGVYEAVGFLRVHLLKAFQHIQHPVIMITSTAPGEGKSSVTATLADGLAASGLNVLIVDADLRRGTQETVWKKYEGGARWQQLIGMGGARTTAAALVDPENVEVLQAEERVAILPAGPGIDDTLALLNKADLAKAFSLWREHYDVVLVDSAPLSALADALVLGTHTDGIVMVTEYGQTSRAAVGQIVRRAQRAGLNLLGFVINKADQRDSTYNYNYSYSPKSARAR